MAGPLQLEFVTSGSRVEELPPSAAEITIVGRSNVGKSSLINALAHQRRLAHVSNTPGRTRLLNLFRVADQSNRARAAEAAGNTAILTKTVVDLPGYGFAKAPAAIRAQWQQMIEGYLLERENLHMVVVLIDGVIGATDLDHQMLAWLRAENLPHNVVATKFDKVKSSKRESQRAKIARSCDLDPGDVTWVSAERGLGVDRLRSLIRLWLSE